MGDIDFDIPQKNLYSRAIMSAAQVIFLQIFSFGFAQGGDEIPVHLRKLVVFFVDEYILIFSLIVCAFSLNQIVPL